VSLTPSGITSKNTRGKCNCVWGGGGFLGCVGGGGGFLVFLRIWVAWAAVGCKIKNKKCYSFFGGGGGGLLRLCARARVLVCVCVRVSYRHCRSAHQTAHEIKRSISVFRTERDRDSRKCV